MAVNRVLYATQRCLVVTNSNDEYIFPIQTASADETIPQDDVLVLGKLGGVGRLQKDVASCKASLKAFICQSVTDSDQSATDIEVNNLDVPLNALIGEAQSGDNCTIWVDSSGHSVNDGFKFMGTLSSIAIDASKGAFPMLDLGFDGVGRLETMALGTTTTLSASNAGASVGYITAATPATSQNVQSSGVTTDTTSSLKFSYDMPTETLSALGSAIIGNTSAVAAGNKVFSKPPFKATMTADGQSLTATETQWNIPNVNMVIVDTTSVDNFQASISSAVNISTRSFSQNVGDVGATFSITAEGTAATFN